MKSPKNDTSGPPAPQGPPIEQLRPAQPPPKYTEFLPGAVDPNTGQMPMATGLTPDMLASIAANQAPPPQQMAAQAPQAPASRDALVQMLAEMLQGRGGPSADQTQAGQGFGSSHGGAASGRSGAGSHGYSRGGLF